MAAPDGLTPDYGRPYEATPLIVVTGIFLPLSVLTMGIRLYTRIIISSKVAFDDCKRTTARTRTKSLN